METFLVRKVKEQERWKMTEKISEDQLMRFDIQIKVVQENENRENHKNEVINKITQGNSPKLK